MGKVLGYILIVAIFVAAAFYLAIGQKGGKDQESKKKTTNKQAENITPTPSSILTKISVFAAGTPALGEYPTMELKIDGTVVQTWKGVKGDAKLGKFDEFTYNFPGIISGQELQVGYTNDVFVAADEDRNLYIDRLVIGETAYLADSPATLTTLTDKTNKQCTDGNTYSRWLRCKGYFTFKSYESAFIPEPTPAARLLSGSVIKVYAAGRPGGGDFPVLEVRINGKPVASFKTFGNPLTRVLGEYSYLHPDKVKISELSIAYLNDFYGGEADDRNLYVDRVNIDGVDYFADAFSVYQTGVWRGGACQEGYLRSKLLWCPGGSMRFGARVEK